jgi:hypothetical protein
VRRKPSQYTGTVVGPFPSSTLLPISVVMGRACRHRRTRLNRSILRRIICCIDWLLRRMEGVFEFSTDEACILRIAYRHADSTLALNDGTYLNAASRSPICSFGTNIFRRFPPTGQASFGSVECGDRYIFHCRSLHSMSQRIPICKRYFVSDPHLVRQSRPARNGSSDRYEVRFRTGPVRPSPSPGTPRPFSSRTFGFGGWSWHTTLKAYGPAT